jgi:hypothetical protein
MFVYMTRAERRAIQDAIRSEFGPDNLPRGSKATFRAALRNLSVCIDEGRCSCHSPCECEHFMEEELAIADNYVRLLTSEPRWWLPRFFRRSEPVCFPVAEPIRPGTSITYRQTMEERFDTDVNERAAKAIRELGVTILDNWGGCWYGPDLPPLCADEGFEVDATPEQVEQIRQTLAGIVGNPETIEITTEPCGVSCRDDEVFADMQVARG